MKQTFYHILGIAAITVIIITTRTDMEAGTTISQSGVLRQAEAILKRAKATEIISDSCRYYLESLIHLQGDTSITPYTADAHYMLGKHHFLLMRTTEGKTHYRAAQHLFALLSDFEMEGFSSDRLGLAHLQEGKLDSALLCFQNSIDLFKRHHLSQHLWSPYLGISSVYDAQRNAPGAFRYGRMAVSALTESEDRTSKILACQRMINLAKSYDSISVYNQYSDALLKMYNPLEIDKTVLMHIGHFASITDVPQRIHAIKEAIDKLLEWPVTLELISSYYQLGEAYAEVADWPAAIDTWHTGYALEKDSLQLIHFSPALTLAISDAYARIGNHKEALMFFKIYTQLKDNVNEKFNKARLDELQIQYETKAKDAEILDQRVALTRRTWQRNGILALLGIFFVGGAYVIFTQRRYLRDQATITQQRDILHQNQIRELTKEHELASLQTLMTAQEEERNRIAQDLHDSLGGSLATLQIQARRFSEMTGNGTAKPDYTEYLKLLNNVSADVRRIAHNMMPQTLIRMGLPTALADLAQSIESSTQLQITFHNIDYVKPVLQEKEIMLYRIAQELCANTLKHAHARHLLIQLSRHNGTATMVVEDDGIGFDMTAKQHHGFGLNSIQSRVRFLQGELEMMSAPNEGTSVTIQIPVA